jgi:hypothetical protein
MWARGAVCCREAARVRRQRNECNCTPHVFSPVSHVPQQHRSPVGTAAKKKTFCACQSARVPGTPRRAKRQMQRASGRKTLASTALDETDQNHWLNRSARQLVEPGAAWMRPVKQGCPTGGDIVRAALS